VTVFYASLQTQTVRRNVSKSVSLQTLPVSLNSAYNTRHRSQLQAVTEVPFHF